MIILIVGISGSGKTTLADALCAELGYARLNADKVRAEANDWDFSAVGRMRQAQRMRDKSTMIDNVIIDMIAPLRLHRAVIKPDKLIWMNTKHESSYKDTDKLFEPPTNADVIVNVFKYNVYEIISSLGLTCQK